jgi:hypothetical protein
LPQNILCGIGRRFNFICDEMLGGVSDDPLCGLAYYSFSSPTHRAWGRYAFQFLQRRGNEYLERPALRYAEQLSGELPANAAHMGTTHGRVCRATSKNREKLALGNPASTGQLSSSLGFDLLFGLRRCGFLRQRHRGHVHVEPCRDVLGIDIRMLLVSRQTAE